MPQENPSGVPPEQQISENRCPRGRRGLSRGTLRFHLSQHMHTSLGKAHLNPDELWIYMCTNRSRPTQNQGSINAEQIRVTRSPGLEINPRCSREHEHAVKAMINPTNQQDTAIAV
ncbi:hypothetical protein AOLI_G00302380 [Acnodon oligacanthus]